MFDVIGAFAFKEKSIELDRVKEAFSGIFSHKQQIKRKIVENHKMCVVCRGRAEEKEDYAYADFKHLFLVGEAFARLDSVGTKQGWKGRLSAWALLDLFMERGDKLLQYIKGNFTLVIVNERLQQITLYNSHFGISPFYYAIYGQRFLFSTSLATIVQNLTRAPELDLVAIAELSLFNYPLGDRTYFQQVQMLRPAEKIIADIKGIRSERYGNVRTLYDVKLLSHNEALEIGASLFHKTVNDLVIDTPRVCVSFTSGFDSRAILSVLEKPTTEYLGYSFGIAGSLNITIPQQIARQHGFPYQPVILNGIYESVFNEYALRAVMLSDCLSTVERANYPYVFEKLADFSPVVITGLFGSELLRTFQNIGHIVSENLVRVDLAANPIAELRQLISTPLTTGYLAPELFQKTVQEVEYDVSRVLIEQFGDMSPDKRFYMFLLTEGLRKYFGAEVHMERPWGTNRFPYLDDEFVEFAFSAPFVGVYSHTIKPSINNRYRSQYFYAYIIRKYRPDLLDAATDHGYSPRDVVSPFGLLKIAPKHLYWRWNRMRTDYREFKTEEWTEALYKRCLLEKPIKDDLFSRKLEEDFKNGSWKKNRLEFAKAASLKLWLEELNFI
jgi:hypothetical protein